MQIRVSFRLGITSTILYRFHQILQAAQKCGLIDGCLWDKLEAVCRFYRCAHSVLGSIQAPVTTFFSTSAPNPMYGYISAMLTLYSMVNETENRNQILEMCKCRFRLVHWIDPSSIEHNYACCLSNALDRPSNQFFPSVCVFVNRSVVERLRPQFFTDFHEILRASQKSGRFVAYCLWDKPEVVCRF